VPNWFSGEVIANGIRVHYVRTGGDGPPLVLAHGFSDNGLCWTPVAQALEGDYDVIMPDARGHGLSEAPETGYEMEDQVADLVDFTQALGLERPALMGHSMGASTVALMAARHPELVSCAVLEDPPWREGGFPPEERRARMERGREEMLKMKALSREALIATCREAHPTWPEAELGPWADAKLQLSLNVLNRRLSLPADWSEIAKAITCPTLLITADSEAGAIVTPELAQEAVRLNPRIQVVRISGAGHSIRREQFDRYMRAVMTFLEKNYPA